MTSIGVVTVILQIVDKLVTSRYVQMDNVFIQPAFVETSWCPLAALNPNE